MKCDKCQADLTHEEMANELKTLKSRIQHLENQLFIERLRAVPAAIPTPNPYYPPPQQPWIQPWEPQFPQVVCQKPLNDGHYTQFQMSCGSHSAPNALEVCNGR